MRKLRSSAKGDAIRIRQSRKSPAQLVLEHDALAKHEVGRWCRAVPLARANEEDLLSEARLALVIASKKWTPHGGLTFGCYARYWIRARLQVAMHRLGPVHVSMKLPAGACAAHGAVEVTERNGGLVEPQDGFDYPERLLEEFRGALQVMYRRNRGRGIAPDAARDFSWWVRYRAGDCILDDFATTLTRQGVANAICRVERYFEEWAAEVRAEAA